MKPDSGKKEAGFSLIELLVAMCITIVIACLASNLLAGSFKIRAREDRRSDAIADVQRALNIMTREIANAGYSLPSGLPTVSSNGLVAGDCDSESIRLVSNLNGKPDASDPSLTDTDVTDADEDVKFLMYVDNALGQRYIVRFESNAGSQTTVLANRVDSLVIRYYDEKVTYSTALVDGVADITDVRNSSNNTELEVSPSTAKYIVITVGVTLPAVGAPGSEGYQPEAHTRLTSDVVLRNAIVY
jgi:Tfp pilus assembly protein PilW